MSDISCKDFAKHVSDARQKYYIDVSRDPVMEHILHLQQYRREIERMLNLSGNVQYDKEDSANHNYLSSIPKLPELTEFLHYKNQNVQICEIELSEESVKSILSKVVTRILLVIGYSVASSSSLQMLSCFVYNYIKFLVTSMVHYTSLNEPLTVESLKKALKQDGSTDIEGLYNYKEDHVVKFRTRLYSECKRLNCILENNLKKPNSSCSKPLKRKKVNILEKEVFYDISTVTEVNQNENLLESEQLVEDEYLN